MKISKTAPGADTRQNRQTETKRPLTIFVDKYRKKW